MVRNQCPLWRALWCLSACRLYFTLHHLQSPFRHHSCYLCYCVLLSVPSVFAKLPSDSRRRLNSISRSGFISSPAKKMHRRALLLTAQAGRRSPSSLARRTPPTDLSDAAMKERLADRSAPVDRPAAPAAPGSQLDRQTYRHYLLQKAPQDMTDPRQ